MPIVRDYIDAEIAAMPQVDVVRLPDYGEDYAGLHGIADWRIIQRGELLKQQAYRRITTATGSYYGEAWGIDAQEFVHSKLTDAEIAGRIQVELLRDDRLQSVTCVPVRRGNGGLRLETLLVPRDLAAAGVPLTLVTYVDEDGAVTSA